MEAMKDGKSAYAYAPKGQQLLNLLPPDIRREVQTKQFVKVNAIVSEKVLIRIETN